VVLGTVALQRFPQPPLDAAPARQGKPSPHASEGRTMSKARASYYVRMNDLIVSATSTLDAPDALDELRTQVVRGFGEALSYADGWDDEDAEPDPGTVPTTDLPPLE
jgi:hypothetical protein